MPWGIAAQRATDISCTMANSPATTPNIPPREEVDDIDSLFMGSVNDISTSHKYNQSISAVQRLGGLSIAIFCLTSLSLTAAVGFLIFLWTPSDQISWRAIATTAWLPRSVTLSSLVIRVAVDLLTGLSASMVAAVVLETESVYLGVLASVSIMRGASPSPWDLLWEMRHAHKKLRLSTSLILALLLGGLSLSLQFTSTILLSDFRMGEIAGMPNDTFYSYDLDWGWDISSPIAHLNEEAIYNTSFLGSRIPLTTQFTWAYNPAIFPTFGEYHEPIPGKEGIDDTGYILRSFLPFSDAEERRKVKEFRGPAFVLDSRVSCQRPIITNVTGLYMESISSGYSFVNITGYLSNSSDITGLWRPTHDNTMLFFCYIYMQRTIDGNATDIGSEICQVQGKSVLAFPDSNTNSTFFLPTEGAGSLRSQLYEYDVEDPFPSYGPAFLLISGEGSSNRQNSGPFTNITVPFLNGDNFTSVGPYPHSEEIFFSLCFTSWESSIADVDMKTLSAAVNEPQVTFEKNDPFEPVTTFESNLDSILEHYGLGNNLHPRSVLDMKKPLYNRLLAYPLQQPRTSHIAATMSTYGSPIYHTTYGYPFIKGQLTDFNQFYEHPGLINSSYTIRTPLVSAGSWTMEFSFVPASDSMLGFVKPAGFYQEYFQQAMRLTNNSPALVLSGLLTLFASSSYYNLLPLFSRNGTAEVVYLVSVSYPQAWNGLIAVISLLVAFVLTCVAILYMFLSRTQYSRIGNSWSNVSQIYGSMTEDILRNGTMLSDAEVEKCLLERDKEKRFVRIVQSKDERMCKLVSD